jgi:hypothetical protein
MEKNDRVTIVMSLDEPFSHLISTTPARFMLWVKKIHKEKMIKTQTGDSSPSPFSQWA